MAELMLHFDPDSGVDPDAVAEALRRRAADLPEITAASVETDHSRIDIPDVLMAITVATTVLSNSAAALDALRKTIHALKGIAEELGLRNVRVEVGMSQVPAAELTDAQATQALQGT